VIAVNNSWQLAPFADAVFAMDRAWWAVYGPSINCDAELWTSSRESSRIYHLNLIGSEPGGGLASKPNSIRLGGNSGYQAVCLALHFGATKIILLGYDMKTDGKRTHWHGDHQKLGNPHAGRFRDWLAHFDALNRQKPAGVEIVNASRETALRAFPRVAFETALAM
jgi:hypothetical protein